MKLRAWVLAGMCVAVAGLVWGQAPPDTQAGAPGGAPGGAPMPGDPPGRVARLNFMNGDVSFRPDSVPDWSPATLNFPLTTGYHLWTDQNSHAELHIGSMGVRLADETALAILNLDDHISQFSMTQGALNVHVAFIGPGESIEVDTPNGAVTLLQPGSYRFDVNPQANFTAVTVRAGDAEVTAGGQAFPVHAMQQGHFTGSDQVSFDAVAVGAPDPWDQWCLDRDMAEQRGAQASAPYVPREMNGVEDLGANGTWRQDPSYGAVWVPSGVAVGWAPYRYGHWAFIPPWGWTWVDDAPWGFAPFHYGRWVVMGGVWGWAPGRIGRPVYAPALVAFVGGPGFGMGIGFGGVGFAAWVPLGFGEVYRPAWRPGGGVYVGVTFVNRAYVTAVPQAAFVGARPIGAVAVRVPAEAVARIQPVEMSAVRPTRESFAGRAVQPGVRVPVPPAATMNRAVIARTPLPPNVRPAVQVHTAGVSTAANTRPAVANDRPPTARQPGANTQGAPTQNRTTTQPAAPAHSTTEHVVNQRTPPASKPTQKKPAEKKEEKKP